MKIRDLETIRIQLKRGDTYSLDVLTPEAYIHPLIGEAQFNERTIGGRKNVFEKPGLGMLVGPGEYNITCKTYGFDCIVAYAAGNQMPRERAQAVAGCETHIIGKGAARREVREILGHDGYSHRLRVGETVNRRGGWSSWPPHSFDKDPANASKFEEVFYYFTDPKDGVAFQVQGNKIEPVLTGTEREIELGYHPVVGAPGVKLLYVWFYLSPEDKIYPRFAEDLGGYK